MDRMDQLLLKMMEYDKQDAKRIQHFIKVHEFARLIGKIEWLDEGTQEI